MKLPLTITKPDRLNINQQLIFLDYLRQILANGFSLNTGLKLMPEIWPTKKKLLKSMSSDIEAGKKFSEILSDLGFSKTTVSQIDMALEQGSLIDCLDQLAQLNRLKAKQLKKIKAELAYPAVLMGMMLLLLFFMHTFLQSEMMTSSLDSDILFASLVFLVIVGIIAVARIFYLLEKQDYLALKQLSKYPIIGKTIKTYIHYLIVYDLALLLQNGFSLQQICLLLQNQPKGSLQQVLGEKIHQQLKLGKNLTEIIENERFLPQSLLLLTTTGSTKEEVGKRCVILGKTLFYELNLKISRLVVNVQPICFVFIGLCVLGMYLKILLPMYTTMQNM